MCVMACPLHTHTPVCALATKPINGWNGHRCAAVLGPVTAFYPGFSYHLWRLQNLPRLRKARESDMVFVDVGQPAYEKEYRQLITSVREHIGPSTRLLLMLCLMLRSRPGMIPSSR